MIQIYTERNFQTDYRNIIKNIYTDKKTVGMVGEQLVLKMSF